MLTVGIGDFSSLISKDGVKITAVQARELRHSFEDVLLKDSVAIFIKKIKFAMQILEAHKSLVQKH